MKDIIAEKLIQIKNAEKKGEQECILKGTSKLLKDILTVMNKEGYIGEFEIIDDGRGGLLKLSLIGKINMAGAIKPPFSAKMGDFEKFEKRYLPAKNFGILILSTIKGIMTHEQAKKAGIGGQLLAYVY
jgi:small subunit ribosomal protein S8